MTAPANLNRKQRQIYNQFKDDPDFDMEKALAVYATPKTAARQVKRVKDTGEASSREIRLVIELLHRRVELVQRKCLVCSRTFACDYLYTALCSDTCRAEYIYSEYGITWDSEKSEQERWGGQPPSIIRPETFEQLRTFAQAILELPTPDDFVGRTIPSQYSSEAISRANSENGVSVVSDTKSVILSPETSGTASSVSEPLATVRAAKESDEAQALKKALDEGNITKTEYLMQLADLF